MKRSHYRLYSGLMAFAGLTAAAWTLFDGPTGKFSLATSRLGLAGLILLPSLAFLSLFVLSFSFPAMLERLDSALASWLGRGHNWLNLATLLSSVALLAITGLAAWGQPFIHDYSWYATRFPDTFAFYETFAVFFGRSLGLLSWLGLFALSGVGMLFLRFGSLARRPGAVARRAVVNRVLIVAMLLAAAIHWLILAGQATFFTGIPGWYWENQVRPFNRQTLIFIGLAAFALAVVWLVSRRPGMGRRNLILIFITGLVLQYGFGFVSGEGVEWVRGRYADSHHQSYAIFASQEVLDPLEVIRNYEAKFGQRMFPSTKPPGVLVFYTLAERVSHALMPADSDSGRLQALTTLIAYTFPFMAFLMVGVLYAFLRTLTQRKTAIFPPLFYVLLPNMILIPSFLDQAMYPMLFTLGAWLMVETVRRRSLWLALASGIYFYVAAFFSFSMLPMFPFFLVLLGLDFLRNPRKESFLQAVKMTGVLAAGFLLMFFIMRSGLNYDLAHRYTTAMRVVRNFDFVLRVDETAQVDLSQETIIPRLDQILGAARLNLTEFAAAVGFPLFLLFLSRSVSIVAAFIRRKATRLDWVLGAYLITFLALNAYGQVQGEVSRLWLFWTPMVVMFAGTELKQRFGGRPAVVLLVALLQLITIFMTFQFQEFIV